MRLYLLELSLGTALALASFASGPDEVRYAPAKGLKVTRTCEMSSELELGPESVTYDGEERLDPRKKSSGSLSIEQKFVVSDELVAVGSDRPEELARTFDELHQQQTYALTLEGQAAVTEGVSYEMRGQSVEMVRKFSGTTRYSFAVERAD